MELSENIYLRESFISKPCRLHMPVYTNPLNNRSSNIIRQLHSDYNFEDLVILIYISVYINQILVKHLFLQALLEIKQFLS